MKFFNERTKINIRKRLFLPAAVFVVFITLYSFISPAVTLDKKTYCGKEEHTHTEECYTVTESCICGLDETEGHKHTEKCYTEEKVLICELDENEQHEHTDACYETEKILTCGKQETEGHQHDDSCFITDKELTCGKEEHIHTDDCFVDPDAETEPSVRNGKAEDSNDSMEDPETPAETKSVPEREDETEPVREETPAREETSAETSLKEDSTEKTREEETESETAETETDEAETETAAESEPDPEVSYPEMVLQETIKDDLSGSITEIEVHAPEGALPEGCRLLPELYEPEEKEQAAFGEALDEVLHGGLLGYRALKITFADAAGVPVTSLETMKIVIRDGMVKDAENIEPVLLNTEQMDHLTAERIAPESGEDADEDAVTFKCNPGDHDILVIASTSLEKTLLAKGTDYSISVGCSAKACIPAGAALTVKEIRQNTRVYNGFVSDAERTLDAEAGEITYARFFDITIVDQDGNEVQPEETVDVAITLDDLQDNIEDPAEMSPQVLHFQEEEDPETVGSKQRGDEVRFGAEGFSVYGVVVLSSGNEENELHNKHYGIVNSPSTVSGTAMQAKTVNSNTLKGLAMTVRSDPRNRTENVFVAKNSNIDLWTFNYIADSDNQFYITAEVNGALKYLKIGASGIGFVDREEIDDTCRIKVTGRSDGRYKFTTGSGADSRVLVLKNGNFTSAAGTVNDSSAWMNFAELSDLSDNDFVTYKAKKVSVSDTEKVFYQPEDEANQVDEYGTPVVVYARVWNDDVNVKKYEYYAIDGNGNLIKCGENGDTISWVGSRSNNMLWKFIEMGDGYYALQNTSSGLFLAPRFSDEGEEAQILMDPGEPGSNTKINLNGRVNGAYYTKIMAWDDQYYDYAGLSVDEQDLSLTVKPGTKSYDFYFAVMDDSDQGEIPHLTTVRTIDHSAYNITLKMQDYAYGNGDGTYTYIDNKYRSKEQTDVLGTKTEKDGSNVYTGMLSKTLDENGYPHTIPSVTKTPAEHSLYELYDETVEVNNLFLASTHAETGYFEYDSTKNFAHLNADGTFTVYDQIGTSEYSAKATLQHGQFLPYNDLQEGRFSVKNPTNETDLKGHPLDTLDPRKGERLFGIPGSIPSNGSSPKEGDADYFFGMEMTAKFMQTESGEDDWGHDLIFEFSGDDDFWLYVDGTLVLDLGGVHSAVDGKINFKTGYVNVNGRETNLRQCFKDAGIFPDGTPWVESNAYKYFKGNTFTDYSGHTMRMFYMERGASASNLHMRFNLAPYTDGEVLLEKEVTGAANVEKQFPFQIFIYDDVINEWRTVGRDDLENENAHKRITVTDTSGETAVRFEDQFEGKDNVFFLKSGDTASIKLPSEDMRYYIRECLIDPEMYDAVSANGDELDPDHPDTVLQDFTIAESTVANRKKVIYTNHVNEDALHKLTITKKLWQDEEKTMPLENDDTGFSFRIFLGKENGVYKPYGHGFYHVKNESGEYCIYRKNQGFVSTGKTDIHELDTEPDPGQEKSEYEQATFETSPGGGVSRIPAGYSVEIRGLLDGTEFYVFERSDEIPDGYKIIDYDLYFSEDTPSENDYDRSFDADPDAKPAEAEYMNSHALPDDLKNCYGTIDSTVHPGKDPVVIVNNQHGWHLKLNKIWSDQEFMESHDTIFFAVYKEVDGQTAEVPEDGSVRGLVSPNLSLRWFFDELDPGTTLNDYKIYEIVLKADAGYQISVDPDSGIVSTVNSITNTVSETPRYTITEKLTDHDTMNVLGLPKENTVSVNHTYEAVYSREVLEDPEAANVRTDTVSNSRSGIMLVKTDMNNRELGGAVFKLEDSSGRPVGAGQYVSNSEGLIAVAYLTTGQEYTLTEITPPFGYERLLNNPLVIKEEIDEDGNHTLYASESGAPSGYHPYYEVIQVEKPTASNMPEVRIRNKQRQVKFIKVDSTGGQGHTVPLAGAEFALYAAIVDSTANPPVLMPDYNPMKGFEKLVTDADGVVPKIDLEHLQAGTYYLRESNAPEHYMKMNGSICFTLSASGELTINSPRPAGVTDNTVEADGVLTTTVSVPNVPKRTLEILKLLTGTQTGLPGAEFELYKISQIGNNGLPVSGQTPFDAGTTDENGVWTMNTGLDEITNYYLFETKAPEGCIGLTEPVIITVTSSTIMASYQNKSLEVEQIEGTRRLRITVNNSAGVKLPASGGPGSRKICLLGVLLIGLAGCGFMIKRMRRNRI